MNLLDASEEFTEFMIDSEEFDEGTLDEAVQAFHRGKFGYNDAKREAEILEIFNNYIPPKDGQKAN